MFWRRFPWQRNRPDLRGVVYSLVAVAAVLAMIIIIDCLQRYGLHL